MFSHKSCTSRKKAKDLFQEQTSFDLVTLVFSKKNNSWPKHGMISRLPGIEFEKGSIEYSELLIILFRKLSACSLE